MDSPSIDHILTRWPGVLADLAKGPDGYGPHAVEVVCAALDKALTERDEARRQLDEERARVEHLTPAEPVAEPDGGDCWTCKHDDPRWCALAVDKRTEASLWSALVRHRANHETRLPTSTPCPGYTRKES